MVKWFKANILDLIQSVGLVGVAMAAVIAWLQSVPWYLALLGLLSAVVLILFGINQYEIRKERHKKKLTQLSDKELQSEIRNWIDIPAWSVQPQPPQGETMFAYQVEYKGIHIAVVREKQQSSIVVLITKFTMQSEKTNLSEVEWQRLSSQLSIELARFGIEYDFIGTPNKAETIELVEPVILDDSLTPYYFRSRIMFVVRGRILAHELWKEALRQSAQ